MKRKKSFNLRSCIEDEQIDYIAALRDGAIFDNYGLQAEIKTPKIENNLDEYVNFVDDDFYISTSVVAPKFTEYRTVLSQLGQTAEENYPLEIVIPTALHLPRNSRIILTEYDANENKTAREWRVLSVEVKQLSNSRTYSKIAKCVPARASIYITSNVDTLQCYIHAYPLEDYVVLSDLVAYSCNYGRAYDVANTLKNNIEADAEAICRVYWNVKLPSILY